jgi:Transglutaminase-like superfamily
VKPLPTERPLGPLERTGLVAEIVAAYLRARYELRRAPLQEAVGRLRSHPGRAVPPGRVEESRRLGRAVVRTLAFLPGDTRCLRRSLVLVRLLSRRGISTRLVIGARSGPEFIAHAWVESEGVPVLTERDGEGGFGRLVEL